MKKRKKVIITILVLAVLLGAGWWYLFLGGRITDASDEMISGADGTRSLVVYFSRSGEIADTVDAVASATPNSNQAMDGSDTEAAAKMIQELTGADLYQIRTERYYRSAFWGTAAAAWIEETLNLRPSLAAQPEDLDDYDVIYVGYPIWWYDMPQALYSFFDAYDFSGKTIIPFNVHNGSRFSGTIDTIKELEPDATVVEDGFTVNERNVAEALEDVAEWLNGIGY